ncbi:superoxide dismutase family protein [Verrucomicrobiota bacterium sgz303538]
MKNTIYISAFALASFLTVNASAQEKSSHEHGKASAAPTQAVAVLVPTQGNQVKGTITFSKVEDGVRVQGEISGLTPGKHGFHVHEFGDITSADGKSAGGHFNPASSQHGAPDAEKRHAGDFGNVEADQSGTAKVNFVDKLISFDGATSVLGRGLVVHAKADDLKTQPTGDAGDRVAVGVIGVAKGEAAAK